MPRGLHFLLRTRAKTPAFLTQLVAAALLLSCGIGCTSIMPEARGRSPLKTPVLTQNSLVLDIFFVTYACDDAEMNEDLWDEIDEQHFSPQCRRQLFHNGFRVGRVGNRLPVELAGLLELGEEPVLTGQANRLELEDLTDEPGVRRRHLQIQPGQRSEIIASGVYEQLPVITKDGSGEISGEVLQDAQAIFALDTQVENDGRVRLSLTPEVHHGRPQRRWTSNGPGVLQLESSRDREVFESLTAEAVLQPGDMMVVCGLPSRSGSLGHHFFSETKSGEQEQKLLLIRLSQTQHDDLFDAMATDDF